METRSAGAHNVLHFHPLLDWRLDLTEMLDFTCFLRALAKKAQLVFDTADKDYVKVMN